MRTEDTRNPRNVDWCIVCVSCWQRWEWECRLRGRFTAPALRRVLYGRHPRTNKRAITHVYPAYPPLVGSLNTTTAVANSQSTILDLFSNRRGSVPRKVSSRNPCVKQCLPTRLNSSNTVLDDEIPRNCPEVRGCTLSVITKEHACGNDADQEGHCKDRWIN